MKIKKYLSDSETYLKIADTPLELALTQIELTRLLLDQDNQESARLMATKARFNLSGFHEDSFPDELRPLLDENKFIEEKANASEKNMTEFKEMLEQLSLRHGLDKTLTDIISMTNQLFDAERGVIFWTDGKLNSSLKARAYHNISIADVASRDFQSNMEPIFRCRQKNQVITINKKLNNDLSGKPLLYATLCIPVTIKGVVCGVIYHDNSFARTRVTALDTKKLTKISEQIGQQINLSLKINQMLKETRQNAVKESIQTKTPADFKIIAKSPLMLDIMKQADQMACSDSTILILGETGVGKELMARRIHEMSPRAEGPFIIVDPTAIPDTLVESELFGHEKGAFTGADQRKPGRVELSHKGTLFIDEVGEMPLSIQVKFLRILQEKAFIRIGGTSLISADFRLVVATNKDLSHEVEKGRFRKDLYYRINTVPITLPPLRQRGEDIQILARHFLDYYGKKYSKPDLCLLSEHEAVLNAYPWPGNIRELENVIERAAILSDKDHLELVLSSTSKQADNTELSFNESNFITLDEHNRRYIKTVLKATNGKLFGPGGAGEILDINPFTLRARIKKLGIS